MKELEIACEVLCSWRRCMEKNLESNILAPIQQLRDNELALALDSCSTLLKKFDECMKMINNLVDEEYCFMLTDCHGTLLKKGNNKKNEKLPKLKEGMSLAEASSGTNSVALAIRIKEPFYTMPEQNYCKFFREIYCYAVPILIDEKLLGCLAVGAVGYSIKNEIVAITKILSSKIAVESKNVTMENKKCEGNYIKLNNKQLTILRLLAKGVTDRAAALEMKVSIDTIRYHKRIMFQKLDCSNVVEMIVKAIKFNLLLIE